MYRFCELYLRYLKIGSIWGWIGDTRTSIGVEVGEPIFLVRQQPWKLDLSHVDCNPVDVDIVEFIYLEVSIVEEVIVETICVEEIFVEVNIVDNVNVDLDPELTIWCRTKCCRTICCLKYVINKLSFWN